MPKFDAGSIGGKIEYDFTEWGGGSGAVPEPSKFAVKKFMKDVQAVFKEISPDEGKEDGEEEKDLSPNELVEKMNEIDDEQIFDKLTDGITDCIAELCGAKLSKSGEWSGGSPSHAELSTLDYRPFMGFFGYLMENLMNPELSRPGTNSSPRRLRSV